MGYGYDGDGSDEDEGESTMVFGEGIPLEPVDSVDDLPTPPLPMEPRVKARCYVRKENAFYEWDGKKWEERPL